VTALAIGRWCGGAAVLLYLTGALPAAQPQTGASEVGEKIVNSACIGCHELRPLDMTALDREGWSKIVDRMVAKGAAVRKEDVPMLVAYLATAYGPVPEGPGKDVLLIVCTQCHTLDRVKARRSTPEEWDELLMHMLNEGAPLADRDYPVLLTYLARNFRR
jgi:cytochrome c5